MSGSSETKSVLVLGNYRPTLQVAKTLREMGYRVIVSESDKGDAGARYSRYVDEMWAHPPLGAIGGLFGEALNSFLRQRPDIKAVFPVAEEFVVWLAEHESELPAAVTVVSPDPDVVRLCLDKVAMLGRATEAGVVCAPYGVAESLGELYRRSRKIGFPVVVRPFSHLNRIGHKKAVVCRTRAELEANFAEWPDNQDALLIQRFISGHRHDLYFIASDGEIKSLLETKVIRTDHLDGTGLSTEGAYVPVTPAFARDARRLLRKINYTGIGCIQFIRDDRTGTYTFLELNPRIAGSHRCAEAMGMNLTRAALALAHGADRRCSGMSASYPAGGYYAWVMGDLYGFTEAIARREIGLPAAIRWVGAMARSLLRARVHLMFSWDDPRPSLALLLRHPLRALAKRTGMPSANGRAYPSASAQVGGVSRQGALRSVPLR